MERVKVFFETLVGFGFIFTLGDILILNVYQGSATEMSLSTLILIWGVTVFIIFYLSLIGNYKEMNNNKELQKLQSKALKDAKVKKDRDELLKITALLNAK